MLDFVDCVDLDRISFNDTSSLAGIKDRPDTITLAGNLLHFDSGPRDLRSDLALSVGGALRIGLIDNHRFSQECLLKAFDDQQPRLAVMPFSNSQECIAAIGCTVDVVIYHSHGSESEIVENISILRHSFNDMPLIVLSDAEDADQSKIACKVLKLGAQCFIPTRTMGIPIIVAAIRFVQAGGTFAPLDLLLTKDEPVHEASEPVQEASVSVLPSRLTSRQIMVLEHLQQGKANKIIAHELSMSESTVKVHIRNIMRKMGATNRTQAVYKAKTLHSESIARS